MQLHTPANQVPPGTVWTGDVPQAWLEEPDVPEEQRVSTVINLKVRLVQSLLPRRSRGPRGTIKAHTQEVINALVTLMSLNEPVALYDAAKAPDLQDVPVMAR